MNKKLRERLSSLLNDIHECRLCPCVHPNLVVRELMPNVNANLVLMAQAPSEHGVRESGVHWMGSNGDLRKNGGTYMDKYLRRIGYSIDPHEDALPRPYITNVLHCWTGRNNRDDGDRTPRKQELKNCRTWWTTEIRLLKPKALLLVGGFPADAVGAYCNPQLCFQQMMMDHQGDTVEVDGTSVQFFTVPQPVSRRRYPCGGRNECYQRAFSALVDHFAKHR